MFLIHPESARRELVEKARDANKHGLLVCGMCGWSWLTVEDATPDYNSIGDTYVVCRDKYACTRRGSMRMHQFFPSKRSKPGRFYDFNTGRRASPLCVEDSIGPNGIIRGKHCSCHLPGKVN